MRCRGLPTTLLALAIAPFQTACAPSTPAHSIDIETLIANLGSDAPATRAPEGLALALSGANWIRAGFPALRALELDIVLEAPLDFFWAPFDHDEARPGAAPPHLAVLAGAHTLRFDLASCAGWCAESGLEVLVFGTGRMLVTAARVESAPADPAEFQALADRATRWAPEHLTLATINFLRPPWWNAVRTQWLPDRLALLAALAAVAVFLAAFLRRRRARPAVALVAGALVAGLGYDVFFLRRTLPALDLAPVLDREARIRDHYHLAPYAGALAALARAELRPDERVGVVGDSQNPFAANALCYLLAPRRAVLVRSRQSEYRGLGDVERLKPDELDAIVLVEVDPLLAPKGFTRVSGISARAFVARRP